MLVDLVECNSARSSLAPWTLLANWHSNFLSLPDPLCFHSLLISILQGKTTNLLRIPMLGLLSQGFSFLTILTWNPKSCKHTFISPANLSLHCSWKTLAALYFQISSKQALAPLFPLKPFLLKSWVNSM